MKVKKNVLVEFLKRSTMTGVSALVEGILDFTEKGIKISSQSASNNVLVYALLRERAIEDYKPIGQVGINNLQDMVKLLDGFIGEYINFEIKSNQLIFKSARRKVKITLMDKDVVAKPTEYPTDLKERLKMMIDVDILKGFFRNMGILNTAEFSFIIKGKDFYFNTKGFNEVTEKIDIKEGGEDTNIRLRLNKAFIDAVENLTGEIELEMKSNYPITVKSKTKSMIIKILIAPIVEEVR